jgi:hypothetical protein
VRARRQAWWIALVGSAAVAPALASPGEPAPKPAPLAPKPAPPAAATPAPPRRYRAYVYRGNSIPAPYALGTLGFATNVHVGTPAQAELNLGFGVGLTSRIWLDGAVGTLRVAPSLVFHSAQVGPNVLIVDVPAFELDAMVHVSGPADDGRPVEQVEPGLYTVVHAGDALRVDTSLGVDVNPGPTTTSGFRVATAIAFQLTEHVYGAFNTGVTLGSFADARETTAIPAGLTLGWSDYLAPKGPEAIAIVPSILFPQMVRPWANEPFRPGILTCGITFYYVWKY